MALWTRSRIASEGALWGGLTEAKALDGTVILSDGASISRSAGTARCWVHMERRIGALDSFTEPQRRAKARARLLIQKPDLVAIQGPQNLVPRSRRPKSQGTGP